MATKQIKGRGKLRDTQPSKDAKGGGGVQGPGRHPLPPVPAPISTVARYPAKVLSSSTSHHSLNQAHCDHAPRIGWENHAKSFGVRCWPHPRCTQSVAGNVGIPNPESERAACDQQSCTASGRQRSVVAETKQTAAFYDQPPGFAAWRFFILLLAAFFNKICLD